MISAPSSARWPSLIEARLAAVKDVYVALIPTESVVWTGALSSKCQTVNV